MGISPSLLGGEALRRLEKQASQVCISCRAAGAWILPEGFQVTLRNDLQSSARLLLSFVSAASFQEENGDGRKKQVESRREVSHAGCGVERQGGDTLAGLGLLLGMKGPKRTGHSIGHVLVLLYPLCHAEERKVRRKGETQVSPRGHWRSEHLSGQCNSLT